MPQLPIPLPPLPTVAQVVFFGIALITILGALMVVLARNLFHSALGLVLSFFGVAGVYFIAEAEFVGVSQVLSPSGHGPHRTAAPPGAHRPKG